MDIKKYRDMAYQNSLGQKWLQNFFDPPIWDKWTDFCRMRAQAKGYTVDPEIYARKIFTAALWYLGYIGYVADGDEVAGMLHTEGGRGTQWDERHRLGGFPTEFLDLDNFLETYCSPTPKF